MVSGFRAIFRNVSVSVSRASTSTSSGTRKNCCSVSHDVPNIHICLHIFCFNCRNQVLSITLGWPRLQAPLCVADLVLLASARLKLSQALGGSVAIAVGGFFLNSVGPISSVSSNTGQVSVQDSYIASIENHFVDCAAESLTEGSSSISFGASLAFGGAFAILHAPQITDLQNGLQLLPAAIDLVGFNFDVIFVKSIFSRCSATSTSQAGRSAQADAIGGAVFARSVALSNFSVIDSHFIDSVVKVGAGAGALPSHSSGGAVVVEFNASGYSVAVFASCSFVNCAARGADSPSTAVTGGAISVSFAASVAITDSKFINCKIQGALSVQSSKISVSGGAGVSLSRSKNASVHSCLFDATDGQDDSATSTGLAIFAASSSYSRTDVTGTSFKSSAVIVSVRCVSEEGLHYVGCPVIGPQIFVSNSSIAQLTPNASAVFKLVGSSLMSFDPQILQTFTRFGIKCSLADFAVFKEESPVSSAFPLDMFSCKACSQFEISLSANEAWLEQIVHSTNASNCVRSSVDNNCPYGVKRCQTFVDVEQGFWTNFSESGGLLRASRCPDRYCGCDSSKDACPLSPLLAANHVADSLCRGNRSGVLCGGCRRNFTHSLNGYSCVSNDDCSRDFGWVWTLTVVGFVLESIYIVFTSVGEDDGFINCVLFYGQMSLFARIPPVSNNQADNSDAASWFSKSSQFSSILSAYQNSCFGPSMGAYEATAAQLIGPLTVFMSSMLLIFPAKLLLKKFHHFFRKRKLDVQVTFATTLMNLLLMLFSSVSSVVFQLITCQDTGQEKVVFIDGTKTCSGAAFNFLSFLAAMLSLVPLVIWAGLKFNRIPAHVRAVLCSPYTDDAYYWVALALLFRFVVSVLSATVRQFPSVSAMVLLFCTVCMLMLLTTHRPYVDQRTYYMDIFCYFCLIVQYMLQSLAGASESLGLSLNQNSRFFDTVRDASTASDAIQSVFLFA
jgi:hypothetical protein